MFDLEAFKAGQNALDREGNQRIFVGKVPDETHPICAYSPVNKSEQTAMAEMQASPDPFIRNTLPLAVTDFSGRCDDFEHALSSDGVE